MHLRGARSLTAFITAVLVLSGCGEDDPNENRAPGDPITVAEAEVLAEVLHRNTEEGGADVTVTAQYAEEALLTMTGSIDFSTDTGTLDAVTTYTTGQPDDLRTIYFDADRIVIGNIPGFTDAMATAGRTDALYLRTDLDQETRLLDNVAGMLNRLAADEPDDPDNLIAAGYTWEGASRIDSVLTNTFRTTVASISIGIEDRLLRQYVTSPAAGTFPVRITLSNHGPNEVAFPPEEQIADASAYPEIAAQFGF